MNEGYEFRFRTAKGSLVLAIAGATGTAVVGAVALVPAAVRAASGEADPRAAALVLAGSIALIALSLIVLRRALLQAYDCRVGEAGVYYATLREERRLAWSDVLRVEVSGRLIRIVFAPAGEPAAEVWVEAPRGTENQLTRLDILARGRIAART